MPNNNFSQVPYFQNANGLPQQENRAQDAYTAGQLGIRFTFTDSTDANIAKRWQLVKQDSTADVVPSAGAVAWWRDASGYRVTADVSVAGRGNVAGIYGGLISPDYVGCVQIGGPANVQFSAGTPTAAGLLAIPTATDGKAEALAAGSAATYPPLGVTLSTATDNVARVELHLPGRE